MTTSHSQPVDPLRWCVAITMAFAAVALVRLSIPHKFYFDEVHYLPAARQYWALNKFVNREHPLLGKEIIGLGMKIFGDNSFGWRIFPLLAGTLTLFAAMRALWFATLSRFATLAYGVLVATGFYLFVHSRIAMLDPFMVVFAMVAYWQLAAAVREPEKARRRLLVAGISMGLALGSKWNCAPLIALPGVVFFIVRLHAGRRRFLTSQRGGPIPGISLLEAGFWLGILPLAVYAATYAPAFFFAVDGIGSAKGSSDLIALHVDAMRLQDSVIKKHPYMSRWPQWVLNSRSIWYLYENVDGAQRGIVLIGNPLTMLLGIFAMVWTAFQALTKRTPAHIAVAVIYSLTLGFWIVSTKPIQFLYHYYLPSLALLAGLALALDALWQARRRWLALSPLVASVALFVFFYPILSAGPLSGGKHGYERWMWLGRWR